MNPENYVRFFLIISATAQTAISIRYIRSAEAGKTIFGEREEGIGLSMAVAVSFLAYCVAVIAYFLNPNWLAWSSLNMSISLRWMGAIPFLMGAAWLLWGLHVLGPNLTISISTRTEHTLVTMGPYHWTRHPLYSGGILESVGVSLLLANWFVMLAAGLFWLLVAYRTSMEEERLIERFGDEYIQYQLRTGRFVPRIRR